jgi:hypothetical protein
MPEEFSIEVSGIEEACAMLTAAPTLLAKNTFARALSAAAVPVAAGLFEASPIMKDGSVYHNPPPGALKAKVMTDVEIDAQGRGGFAQIGFGRLGYVARLVEWGHRMVTRSVFAANKKSGKMNAYYGPERRPVPAHPFMRGVAVSTGEAAIAAFADSAAESLKAGVPGLPTKAA